MKLSLLSLVCSAQPGPGVIFDRYQKQDGLSSNGIRNLAQDQDGFIWIATENALQRFDGHHFRSFTSENEPALLSHNIRNVFCDSRNRLWIYYAHKGVGLWDLNSGKKETFTPLLSDSTSLAEERTFVFYEDRDSTIWLGIHLKGIARFNEDNRDFTSFNIDRIFPKDERRGINTVRAIEDHPSNKDELLVSSFNGFLVLNKESGDLRQLPIHKGNAENPAAFNGHEDALLDIFAQNDSIVWIGTFGGGILRYNLNTERYRSLKVDPPFPGNPVKNNFHQLLKRDENSLWVTFYNHGLYVLDLESETLKMVNRQKDGASSLRSSLKMLKGKYGHLWLSSNRGLVKVYMEKGFTNYRYLGYQIKDIQEMPALNRSLVLPFLSDSVHIYDEAWNKLRTVSYQPVKDFDLNFLRGLHTFKGRIFLQAFEGLYFLDSNLSQIKPVRPFFEQLQEKGRLSIISSLLDSRGNIWMGTKVKGLFRYDLIHNKLYHYSPRFAGSQPVSHHWTGTLYEDKQGLVWMGTEKGYGYFNHRTQRFINFPYPQNSLALDSIHFQECIGFAQNDTGEIWIGAKTGFLGLFHKKKLPHPSLLLESRPELRNQLLQEITEDDKQLYVLRSEGLSIINKNNQGIRNFSSAFGTHQIHRFLGGMNLAIAKGFASTDEFHLEGLPSPKIYLDELMIAGRKSPFQGERIEVSFRENSISLTLGILDLIEKERARLEYRLSDQEQADWTSVTPGQRLSFPYLDHGDYRLEVQAISPSGKVWDKLAIPVEVTPLLWQRWYVQLLLFLTGISLLSFPFLYRLRQKRQRQEMQRAYEQEITDLKYKALKAQVNPHFLFNSLNSIRLLVMKGDEEKATAGISTFSRLVRRVLVHSEKDEVSLADELQAVREYIALEQMRFSNPFLLKEEIDNNVALELVKIPPMLIQPFVENAIWHGLRQKMEGAVLEMVIKADIDALLISIRDNGIGRKAARDLHKDQQKSFGINISRERLKHYRSNVSNKIEVRDLYDDHGEPQGTEVNIRIRS